ncbi:uncharacterized protein L969DRAFT_50188 [Mixia osmundae IAM 14324]|uniref:Uncharacterized protein n=1 Tax=Mixia osmundae (strain CBS 9802 / IAM 14324 / JCM 22182 / KY 12970) TaxID=764103 RepID=G7E6T6_MIXOS|nr:uncharacterized protein L969DRAFT_50188 [Mixia osmundae IAM 14324]KEI39071.1 hypothetical protein L969DRAFT_50188 [Mixia osmundae IAM 14324]GAA98546.1 hypothetical protein E5Q_05233 [Mixia osmundae IAM 14324]
MGQNGSAVSQADGLVTETTSQLIEEPAHALSATQKGVVEDDESMPTNDAIDDPAASPEPAASLNAPADQPVASTSHSSAAPVSVAISTDSAKPKEDDLPADLAHIISERFDEPDKYGDLPLGSGTTERLPSVQETLQVIRSTYKINAEPDTDEVPAEEPGAEPSTAATARLETELAHLEHLLRGTEAELGARIESVTLPTVVARKGKSSRSRNSSASSSGRSWSRSSSSEASSSSSSASSSDDEFAPRQAKRARTSASALVDDDDEEEMSGGVLKTQNEDIAPLVQMPSIEYLPSHVHTQPLGIVESVIGSVVVVRGAAQQKPVTGVASLRDSVPQVPDSGTLVLVAPKDQQTEPGYRVAGSIFETFGSVVSPYYAIRLPSASHPNIALLAVGTNVSYSPERDYASMVFTRDLQSLPKGSDASNIWDEEAGDGEVEFSDDEAEAQYKAAIKRRKQGPNGRQNSRAASQSSATSYGSRRSVLPDPGERSAEFDEGYTMLSRPLQANPSSHHSDPMRESPTSRQYQRNGAVQPIVPAPSAAGLPMRPPVSIPAALSDAELSAPMSADRVQLGQATSSLVRGRGNTRGRERGARQSRGGRPPSYERPPAQSTPTWPSPVMQTEMHSMSSGPVRPMFTQPMAQTSYAPVSPSPAAMVSPVAPYSPYVPPPYAVPYGSLPYSGLAQSISSTSPYYDPSQYANSAPINGRARSMSYTPLQPPQASGSYNMKWTNKAAKKDAKEYKVAVSRYRLLMRTMRLAKVMTSVGAKARRARVSASTSPMVKQRQKRQDRLIRNEQSAGCTVMNVCIASYRAKSP